MSEWMTVMPKRGAPVLTKVTKVKRIRGPGKKATTALIKKVLSRETETKMTAYYSGTQFPTVTAGYQNGNDPQNGLIVNNSGDLKFLVPPIKEGPSSFNREGNRITVKDLRLTMEVSIVSGNLDSYVNILNNIMVVVYIYQHKIYKDYNTMVTQNNYQQLLDHGDGTTGAFSGRAIDSKLPVASQYYKLHKKLMFPLRNSGQLPPGTSGGPTGASLLDNVNSAPFMRRFNINLTKFVPKKLVYKELNPTPNPIIDDFPANSSLSMGIGFYNLDLSPLANSGLNSTINVNWVSQLKYKDD